MATPASGPTPSSTSNSRWEKSGDATSASVGSSTRGGPRNGRGGGRGGRNGGRRQSEARETKGETDKSPNPQTKPRHTPQSAKVAPAAATPPTATDKPSTAPKTKPPASRRGSKAAPPPISVQASVQGSEVTTPSSARPSNKRRRSQANKPSSKGNPNPGNDVKSPTIPEQVISSPVLRDAPPHLSPSCDSTLVSRTELGDSTIMRSNIDALVERVRATAMADARPSTPGSHIDWAGDDDDSLPDLNDWGITTMSTSQTSLSSQAISPIIVDGLKPLPEPIASRVPTPPPEPHRRSGSSHKPPGHKLDQSVLSRHLQQPPPPKRSLADRLSDPKNPRWSASAENASTPKATLKDAALDEAAHTKEKPSITISQPESAQGNPAPSPSVTPFTSTDAGAVSPVPPTPSPPPTSVADSIHAPKTAQDTTFGGLGRKDGLTASIHAPKAGDATSAPATVSSFAGPPHARRWDGDHSLHGPGTAANGGGTHGRRYGGRQYAQGKAPRSAGLPPNDNGMGFNHSARNNSSGGGSGFGGRWNRGRDGHQRNYGPNHYDQQQQIRPVITGDAISKLARTIVAVTPKGNDAAAPALAAGEA